MNLTNFLRFFLSIHCMINVADYVCLTQRVINATSSFLHRRQYLVHNSASRFATNDVKLKKDR